MAKMKHRNKGSGPTRQPKTSPRSREQTAYSEENRHALHVQQAGQTKQSEKLLRNILVNDSEHYEANYALGMLYHHSDRNDLAIRVLKKGR